MDCWNASGNGRRKWKFCSEVHSTLPMMPRNETTSFTGQASLAWSWWTSGKFPNSSTHAMIKELGMVFSEFGQPFMLKSDNGPY